MDDFDGQRRRIGSYALTSHDGARTITITREDGLTGNMRIDLDQRTVKSLTPIINNLEHVFQEVLDMLMTKQLLVHPQKIDLENLGQGSSMQTLCVTDEKGRNHAIGNFEIDNELLREAIEGDWALTVSYRESSRQVAGVEKLLGAKIEGLSHLRTTMACMEQFRLISVIKEHELRVSGRQTLRSTMGSTRHFSSRRYR